MGEAITISWQDILTFAEVVGVLGALVTAVIAVYKVVENNKKQSEFINAMQEEQHLICYGLRGALQGLIEKGCSIRKEK